ncbi:hypothetical protein D6D13_05805 [Aureobasidium pullulans]|uniref:AAA+ ATPase domain-containing protein n=1 Tax=Aureobasidium pullulans TaxID=5580 RepID=A0A4S9CQF7_AURPU|nr:hypothetical protein D6D13_05805 [Aureobasidium pullulans]
MTGATNEADHDRQTPSDDSLTTVSSSNAADDLEHTNLDSRGVADEKTDEHLIRDIVSAVEASHGEPDSDQEPRKPMNTVDNGHAQACAGRRHRISYSFHFHCPKCEETIEDSGYMSAAEETSPRDKAHLEDTKADIGRPQSTDARIGPTNDASSNSVDGDAEVGDSAKAAPLLEQNKAEKPRSSEPDSIAGHEERPGDRDDDLASEKGDSPSSVFSSDNSKPLPPETGVFVEYKNVYMDLRDKDDLLYVQTSYDPIVSAGGDLDQSKAIFDVVAHFKSAVHFAIYDDARDRRGRMLSGPPPVFGQPKHTITIRSQTIIRALQKVVTYYPGFDLSRPTVEVSEPYAPIVNHYDELRAYHEKHGRQGMDVADEETTRISEHLGRLLAYADERIMPPVLEEIERRKRGFVTWNMLWALLRPGTDVSVLQTSSTQRSGVVNRDGAVVETVTYEGDDRDMFNTPVKLTIKLWNLRFDGYKLGRCSCWIDIDRFNGEMELSRLSVLPMEHSSFLDDGANLRQYLVMQGKRFFDILKPSVFQHSGNVMEYPFHRLESQVMVDASVYLNEEPDDRPDLIEGDGDFRRYDNIIPGEDSNLDDHMYFLCPQVVYCYMFKFRSWKLVDVSNLHPAQFAHDMINTLVMDPKRITLLKSLAKSFMRQDMEDESQHSEPWSADYIKGKGNSQIFLLHGRPGVGKTYTAECISEYARRPLMTLSTSDIGTTAEAVEGNLQHHFTRAKSWGAILLIDEADIYLERRSTRDLTRNGLVAGFLRALEYYEGILFLTTNRVGAFDDAFVSRIHVKLHYKALSDDDRLRIWTNFIKKLEAERGDKMRVMRETRKYIESNEIKRLNLNGREIRNIFQTAVGLAEFECHKDSEGKIKLEEDHVAQVADISGEFKQYLDDTLEGDEDKRAEMSFLRKSETPSPEISRR